MLVLGSKLDAQPIVGLQTGGELAHIIAPVINPMTLTIVAYRVKGPLLKTDHYLRIDDVRELGSVGFIVDSIEEFVVPGDVLKLDEIAGYDFRLTNSHVKDEKRKRLGKVIDYTVDIETFTVQQLTVRRPILQSLTDVELIVHRSQIIEITTDAIVIHSKAEVPEHTRLTAPGSYVNPFRKSKPASNSESIAPR